jgi:hypothetical protein
MSASRTAIQVADKSEIQDLRWKNSSKAFISHHNHTACNYPLDIKTQD